MENVGMDEILAVPDAPIQRFLVGDLVEVRQLDKGLRGSWHPARVVEVHEGKRMVEYEELVEDDKSTKLRELVPVGRASDGTLPPKSTLKKSRRVLRLRPLPPAHPDSQPISWQEGVWIEYKFNDAWWEGVLAENITTVNGDDVSLVTRKSEVHVHFPEEDDVRKGKVSDMRIGQEWEEETGIWSLKGSAPVPVPRPKEKKKRGGLRKRSSPEDYSDVDGDEKREIDIVIHSGSKGTQAKVDQKFTRSDTGSSYLDTPFGSVLNFTQKKNAYTLQVTTHDLPKERVSVLVEKDDVVVKARYVVEQQLHNIPARWSGSESSRLTLPNDVEREKITAELENLLTLTLPKQIQSKSRSSRAKV